MKNRSVPCDTVLPHLVYEDVETAIEWLSRVFGFREHYRHGQPAQGAQLRLGPACLMLRTARGDCASPGALGQYTQSITVFVEDVDRHYAWAVEAGALIVEELHEVMYGERQYGAEDPWGHRWLFSQHLKDVAPEEWGARVPQT
jgi:uncharacterized glyoxalase superfamily protein PhnB